MIRIANVTVYVKGQELKTELMTEPEVAAIVECVDDLFKTYGSKLYFDTTLDPDTDTLLVHCYAETEDGHDSHWIPFPAEYETKTITFANRKTYTLIGDRIPIAPRQLGLSPWEFVEIKITNWDTE